MGKLELAGFKCFSRLELPFRNLTILAGGNSVGKSSIIQLLLLLRSSFEDNLTPLNGNYLLNLGNSSQVIKKRHYNNLVYASFTSELRSSVWTEWEADIVRPQVYLKKVDQNSHGSSCSLTETNFHYLHAERLGPRSFYNVGIKERNVGWQGENTIALLSNSIIDTPDYRVPGTKLLGVGRNRALRQQVELWMNHVIPGVEIHAERVQEINQAFVQYNENAPYNVGFGISYVLPIIVAGLIARSGEMLIVENPEAHLHPSGQSRIGQFLAKVAAAGTQVVVETHSEHVINGIRLAVLRREIPYEDVVVNFFNPPVESGEEPKVDAIHLNKQADLDRWPVGFFDQQQQDLKEIFRIRKDQLR